MKNLKIGIRLLATFLGVVFLCGMAGVTGIVLLRTVDSEYSEALHEYGFAQGDIGKLGQSFQAHRATVLYIINAENEQERNKQIQNLNSQVTEINDNMLKVEEILDTKEEQDIFNQLMGQMEEYSGIREQVVELAETSPKEAMQLFRSEAAPRAVKIADTINTIFEDRSSNGNEKSISLSKQSVRFTYIMAGIILCAIAVSIIAAVFITRSILKPINELGKASNELAKGNLKAQLTYHSKDELGQLADKMRAMMEQIMYYMEEITASIGQLADGDLNVKQRPDFKGDFRPVQQSIRNLIQSLNDMMLGIVDSSDQVASGADQVSNGAQALSQGATEQASSVEELASTINEISEHVDRNAGNADLASGQAKETALRLEEGKQQMEHMTSAMGKIRITSSNIGKVVKTIEDIAFQTNILALNAAVEAARAGAAGKGFAVVADEVRALANKSQEASKSTTSLIEDTIHAVEEGTSIALETADSLMQIVTLSDKSADLIYDISRASKEQAESIAQVTQGIDQISSVVQNNSATAEESAAASQELSGQAQQLRSLIGRFKLRNIK